MGDDPLCDDALQQANLQEVSARAGSNVEQRVAPPLSRQESRRVRCALLTSNKISASVAGACRDASPCSDTAAVCLCRWHARPNGTARAGGADSHRTHRTRLADQAGARAVDCGVRAHSDGGAGGPLAGEPAAQQEHRVRAGRDVDLRVKARDDRGGACVYACRCSFLLVVRI